MARGRHYAKLSLSNAARLSFSDLCILLLMFLSLCRLCVCVFLCSHWSLVDVPLIFFCPADHVPDWQPRVLLGMVEARSVNVKKTTTKNNNNSPTGIQIPTKSYTTLQAVASTNNKTVDQTSLTPYREQLRSTRIIVAYPRPAFSATNRTNTFQPVFINNSMFLKATHCTKIRKFEIPRSMVVEALSCAREWKARAGRFLREKLTSDHGHFSSCEGHMERRTGKIRGAFSKMHRALGGWMLARAPASGVQPSPGSSTVELPSAFAESGAYPPDRELPGSPRQ